jgi:VanZ family protein
MNIDNLKYLKYFYYFSLIILLIIYLYPGSLIGKILYGDVGKQPNLVSNSLGTYLNHFFAFLMLSILNVLAHGKNIFFKSSFAILLFLSVTLELFHLIIPNRSFEIGDLLANFFGVIFVAFYFILKNHW